MDLPWGDETSRNFVTNVGLVTSNGPYGHNIMACEWTHHISYSPGLVAICIGYNGATIKNIRKIKEFGISLTSIGQSTLSSLSGMYTGKDTDKIKALQAIGFNFYKGKKIGVMMVRDAALNIECKLYKELELGDHVMVIGEAVVIKNNDKDPLALHAGKYWKMITPLKKPTDKAREEMSKVMDKHKKNN